MTVSIDPVIFSLGPLQVRWYGLMYVVGFVIATFLLKRMSKAGLFKLPKEKVDSLISVTIIGMFLGARLTYIFVYNWDYYSQNFSEVLSVWRGGLSFHGAIIGMALAMYLFAKKQKIHGLHIIDACAIAGSQGLFWGRIGNFINGELYGRTTEVPWGMVFESGGPYPRHPSQLYEAVFEGIVAFLILWLLRKKLLKFNGVAISLFLVCYGVFRYFIEFFREADAQLGYYFGGTTTMGQILCLLMIIVGVTSLMIIRKKNRS